MNSFENFRYEKALHISQHIRLMGHGSKTFDEALENISKINTLFDRQFGPNILHQVEIGRTAKGRLFLDARTRIFTSRLNDTLSNEIKIPSTIDPDNVLERFKGPGALELFYGPDNEVRYYERVSDGEGKR